MGMIRISKDMLLEDILSIRGSIPPDNEEARDKLDNLVSFLSTYPLDEKQSQFPKPSIRKR
jgi:hypothetical protein